MGCIFATFCSIDSHTTSAYLILWSVSKLSFNPSFHYHNRQHHLARTNSWAEILSFSHSPILSWRKWKSDRNAAKLSALSVHPLATHKRNEMFASETKKKMKAQRYEEPKWWECKSTKNSCIKEVIFFSWVNSLKKTEYTLVFKNIWEWRAQSLPWCVQIFLIKTWRLKLLKRIP